MWSIKKILEIFRLEDEYEYGVSPKVFLRVLKTKASRKATFHFFTKIVDTVIYTEGV